MKTEVSNVKNNAVAMSGAFDDFGLEGYGHESKDDFVLPRWLIVGKDSKCLSEGAKFIQGAKPFDIVDTGSKSVVTTKGKPVRVVFLRRDKKAVVWNEETRKPVSSSPLIKTLEEHAKDLGAKNGTKEKDKYKWFMPDDTRVVETWDMYGINLDDNCAPFIISLKDSNLKRDLARTWWSNVRTKFNVNPDGTNLPLPYSWHTITTFQDENDRKEVWSNIKLEIGGKTSEVENFAEILQAAKSFNDILKSGDYKAADDDIDDAVVDDRM